MATDELVEDVLREPHQLGIPHRVDRRRSGRAGQEAHLPHPLPGPGLVDDALAALRVDHNDAEPSDRDDVGALRGIPLPEELLAAGKMHPAHATLDLVEDARVDL